MSDVRKSPFVSRPEFYTTVAVIWMMVGAVAGSLEQTNSSLVMLLLSILASVLCVIYAGLSIYASSARRNQSAVADGGGER